MADKSRVPKQIQKFNTYINETDDRLLEVNPDTGNPWWTDYGMPAGEQADWHNRRLLWRDTIFADYSDPEKSTSIAKQKVRNFIPAFSVFAKKPLDRIVVSDVADEDEETIFRIKLERAEPSHPTTAIETDCVGAVRSIRLGTAKISVRSSTDTSRASIAEDADSVQVSYIVRDAGAPDIADPNDKLMTKTLFFEAQFDLDLGSDNQGRWVNIYFRWYLSRYPQFAGPWSSMTKMVIG
jgi:hypothetical protein